MIDLDAIEAKCKPRASTSWETRLSGELGGIRLSYAWIEGHIVRSLVARVREAEAAQDALSKAFGFTEPQPLDLLTDHARSMTAYGEVPALRARAEAAESEVARLRAAMPCGHSLTDLVGGPGAPTACGRCAYEGMRRDGERFGDEPKGGG